MDYEILKDHPHLPKKGEIISYSKITTIFTAAGIDLLLDDEIIKEFSAEVSNPEIKKLIIGKVKDLISRFLYYDRKEDEELGVGEIEKAIESGLITEDEIIKIFSDTLKASLQNTTK